MHVAQKASVLCWPQWAQLRQLQMPVQGHGRTFQQSFPVGTDGSGPSSFRQTKHQRTEGMQMLRLEVQHTLCWLRVVRSSRIWRLALKGPFDGERTAASQTCVSSFWSLFQTQFTSSFLPPAAFNGALIFHCHHHDLELFWQHVTVCPKWTKRHFTGSKKKSVWPEFVWTGNSKDMIWIVRFCDVSRQMRVVSPGNDTRQSSA